MVTITKEKLEIDNELMKKIEFICSFCNTIPTIINGITFLAFNYSNEIFIENLSNRIKLSDLETYIKQI